MKSRPLRAVNLKMATLFQFAFVSDRVDKHPVTNVSSDKGSDEEQPPRQKKIKRYFREKWKNSWPWLVYDPDMIADMISTCL